MLSLAGAIAVTVLALMPVALVLLVLRLEDERCLLDGVGWLAPKPMLLGLLSEKSATPVDVEEVVDATEADCCRRRDSSLVRRFTYHLWLGVCHFRYVRQRSRTTASCSCSSCKWRSAAVSGLGCLSGPLMIS